MTLKQLDAWHKTRVGHAVFGLIELAVAYGFASLAIDRGNLWYYLLTFVLCYGALQNFIKAVTLKSHDKQSSKTAKTR